MYNGKRGILETNQTQGTSEVYNADAKSDVRVDGDVTHALILMSHKHGNPIARHDFVLLILEIRVKL